MARFWSFYLFSLLAPVLAAPPAQVPFREPPTNDAGAGIVEDTAKKRPLHGRFLHITGEYRFAAA